ncbi:MAG: YbjN domain-containing protein, partial [Hyphomicrobiales bacterium]|nr:YbjN domain-containing protein [Hyphomicrobiales bacterium]
MTPIEREAQVHEHPLDAVERCAAANFWQFERNNDDEVSIDISGRWSRYEVALTWLDEPQAVHVGCAFDFKVAPRRRAQVAELIRLVNARLWIGHFDLWEDEGVVMYRNSLLLPGAASPTAEVVNAAVEAAVSACERHYQAFQFVTWSGK